MNKLYQLLFSFFALVFTSLAVAGSSFAFSSILSAKTIGGGTIVDGIRVEEPEKVFKISTDKPLIEGYSLSNTQISLIIKNKPVYGEVLSDEKGYYSYQVKTPLEAGKHYLYIRGTDTNNNESKEILLATFIVPDVQVKSAAIFTNPFSGGFHPNSLNTSIGILSFILFLGILYAILHKRLQSR
ncbi:MAG: hypothetical protein KBC15_01210 [Candidatus Levybacteria bacterium]|nr:hypothetical protein [Candidatus Levybacteria bacterium]